MLRLCTALFKAIANVKDSRQWARFLRTIFGQYKFACDNCGRTQTTPAELERHMKYMTCFFVKNETVLDRTPFNFMLPNGDKEGSYFCECCMAFKDGLTRIFFGTICAITASKSWWNSAFQSPLITRTALLA